MKDYYELVFQIEQDVFMDLYREVRNAPSFSAVASGLTIADYTLLAQILKEAFVKIGVEVDLRTFDEISRCVRAICARRVDVFKARQSSFS